MALSVNGLYALHQQAKGFATFGCNHRLGAAPLGLVVKAFLNFKQAVVLGLIGHELSFFIAINIFFIDQETNKRSFLDIQFLGRFAKIGQKIAVYQFVKIGGFGRGYLVFHSKKRVFHS